MEEREGNRLYFVSVVLSIVFNTFVPRALVVSIFFFFYGLMGIAFGL